MTDYYLLILEILNNSNLEEFSNEDLALLISKAVREQISEELREFTRERRGKR